MTSFMSKIRKFSFWIILVTMLMAIPFRCAGHAETVVKVQPRENVAEVGELFTINVTVLDAENLYGLEVILDWDPSILYVINVDVRLGIKSHPDGILYEPIFTAKNETLQEQGRYLLAATSLNPANAFNGSGNIVKITFKVIAEGSCELKLRTKLANKPPAGEASTPIVHTTISGTFQTPEEAGWNKAFLIVIITVAIILAVTAMVMLRRRYRRNLKNIKF